jgi:O6-methylguanine-DNA--protein-cysteine methyltransferase
VRAYFSGDLEALVGIAVDGGRSSFEEQVWQAVRAIPAGCWSTKAHCRDQRGHGPPVRRLSPSFLTLTAHPLA